MDQTDTSRHYVELIVMDVMKYVETMVVFSEIPDEITLAINISNCKYHCPGCHSPHLWQDIGTELTPEELISLINCNSGISCVCFMGGEHVNDLARIVKKLGLKAAWYTGASVIPEDLSNLDYIKIGPYVEKFGPLTSPTTNQRLYKIGILNGEQYLINITSKLWKNT